MFKAGQLIETATMLVRDAMNSPLVDAGKLAKANELALQADLLVIEVNQINYAEMKLCREQLDALENPQPVSDPLLHGLDENITEWIARNL
jgi:hypothetical protein